MNKIYIYLVVATILILQCLPSFTAPGTAKTILKKSSNKKNESSQAQFKKDWRRFAPGLTFGGSLRSRGEVKNDFNFNDSKQDYFLTQLRLNLTWQPSEFIKVFIEAQDARVFGEEITAAPSINRNATPNIFADDLDLHRGFVEVKFATGQTPVKIRAGRQKFNLGAQRLVASLEWVNTARVWDGVRATLGNSKTRTLDVFVSRLVPVNPNKFNDHSMTGSRYFNSGFHGLYFTDKTLIAKTKVEAYYFYRHVGNVNDDTHTIGARFDRKNGSVDYNGEVAGQLGEFGGLTHRAFMVHFDGGVKVKSLNNARLGVGYNFATGDSDPADGTHNTFDNLFPLNHAYYGFMDLISLQNIHNFEATFKTKFFKKLGFRAAYQSFWLVNADTDAWYNAGMRPNTARLTAATANGAKSHVGNEIDLTAKYPLVKRIVLVAGYSHFFTGSYISDTGTSNVGANFGFLMTKIKF